MPRPKIHADVAARMRAYRARLRGNVTPPLRHVREAGYGVSLCGVRMDKEPSKRNPSNCKKCLAIVTAKFPMGTSPETHEPVESVTDFFGMPVKKISYRLKANVTPTAPTEKELRKRLRELKKELRQLERLNENYADWIELSDAEKQQYYPEFSEETHEAHCKRVEEVVPEAEQIMEALKAIVTPAPETAYAEHCLTCGNPRISEPGNSVSGIVTIPAAEGAQNAARLHCLRCGTKASVYNLKKFRDRALGSVKLKPVSKQGKRNVTEEDNA